MTAGAPRLGGRAQHTACQPAPLASRPASQRLLQHRSRGRRIGGGAAAGHAAGALSPAQPIHDELSKEKKTAPGRRQGAVQQAGRARHTPNRRPLRQQHPAGPPTPPHPPPPTRLFAPTAAASRQLALTITAPNRQRQYRQTPPSPRSPLVTVQLAMPAAWAVCVPADPRRYFSGPCLPPGQPQAPVRLAPARSCGSQSPATALAAPLTAPPLPLPTQPSTTFVCTPRCAAFCGEYARIPAQPGDGLAGGSAANAVKWRPRAELLVSLALMPRVGLKHGFSIDSQSSHHGC